MPQPCGSAAKWSDDGAGACTTAAPGKYTLPEAGDATIRTGERDCPAGYSCNSGVRTRCGTGTYQSLTGKDTCLPCFTCPSGVTQLSSCTASQNTRCVGTFCVLLMSLACLGFSRSTCLQTSPCLS